SEGERESLGPPRESEGTRDPGGAAAPAPDPHRPEAEQARPVADAHPDAAELADRWRRAVADLENLRKRHARELSRTLAAERERGGGAGGGGIPPGAGHHCPRAAPRGGAPRHDRRGCPGHSRTGPRGVGRPWLPPPG